jgi:uncharacterized GH25 family protein
MKKLLSALVALALLVTLVLFGLRWFGDSSTSDEAPTALPGGSTEEAGAPSTNGVELVVDANGPEDDEAGPETGAGRVEVPLTTNLPGRFGVWPEEGERWVEGRVSLPAGSPPDPTLQIVALRLDLGPEQLYGEGGAATREARSRDRSEIPGALVSVEPVEVDGTFRIPLPPDLPQAWLALDGRYLYSSFCQAVNLEEGSGETIVSAELGGRITGQVILPTAISDPTAIFGETSVLLRPDINEFSPGDANARWMITREAEVSPEGTFEIRAIAPGPANELVGEHPELANFLRAGVVAQAGQDTPLDVVMLAGATLGGWARDKEGRPIEGAEVQVRGTIFWGIPGRAHLTTHTDALGAFTFEHVPPRAIVLTASHRGFLDSKPVNFELGNLEVRSDLELILDHGNSISGVVRWPDGAPAEGAKIKVNFDPNALMGPAAMNGIRGGEGEATSTEDGSFTVGGLGKGPFEVTAIAEREIEEGREVPWRAHLTGVGPDEPEPLELRLDPPLVLSGRVENEAAEPITEFQIHLSSPGAVMWVPGESRDASCRDEEGRFRFDDFTEGIWNLTVSAAGYGPSARLEITLPQVEEEELVIVLQPAAAVEGIVVDPSGHPIAGATVTIETDQQTSIARMQGSVEVQETHSDEEGNFHLAGLSAGAVGVIAKHGDFAPSESALVTVEAGMVIEHLVLNLRNGGTLTGEVYGRDEELASGVTVMLQNPANLGIPTITKTDGKGFFRIEHVPPGAWQVVAMLDARNSDSDSGSDSPASEDADFSAIMENMRFTMIDIADEEELHVRLGAPPANPVRVFGTVTHADEPLEGAMVSFIPQSGEEGLGAMKFTQLDSRGEYEVNIDEPGDFLVQVQMVDSGAAMRQSSIEYPRTIPETEEHRLDFELPLGRISGRVLGPEGKPLESARVTLTIDGGIAYGTFMGGRYGEGSTDAEGHYAFDYLRPGSYSVAAGGSMLGGAFGSRSENGRQIQSGISVSEGRDIDGVDFRLREAGHLSGIVLDEMGRPVASIAIFVRDEAGSLLERFSMITTGADGRFSYNSVAPGGYTVSGRGFGFASIEGELVQVEEGQTAQVTLTLVQGTILLVSVTDKSGEEVRATVSVKDSDGREVNGMVAFTELVQSMGSGTSTGSQRVGPLPPARYHVTVIADDGRQASRPVNLTGQSERKLRVRLK